MDWRTVILGTGNTIVVAAAKEDTGGAFSLLDYELAPGFASLPHHIHAREHEAVYVLEGRLLVLLGESKRELLPSDFVFLPRGIAHSLCNPSPEPARFLLVLMPSGFERCFAELETLLESGSGLEPETFARVLARYGVQITGEDSAARRWPTPFRRRDGASRPRVVDTGTT